ncbi:hypothetical protein JTE90_010101 [Oedothorax gibbosus]|uniref:Uncharacterized protein n=1 Tax=Oedothorax gibbosus TaxID=931172 RepID=A0AAV6U4X8_9ARAC|nr:hypothetical protein JTE90_010101 [Oedothorax gibbosus]
MGRKLKKSSKEYKIERIHRNRQEIESDHLKQRSLIFRIFKQSGNDIEKEIDKQETLLATDCSTVTENKILDKPSKLSTMSNVEEQTELKIQSESSNENKDCEWNNIVIKKRKYTKRNRIKICKKDSELRRTSRKIIVRVNKDFIGTNCIKMARKKKCKESVPINLNKPDEVVVKRGRGRPRKPKPIPSPPDISKKTDDGAVWTLVPKEMIDSDYFKSRVLQVHYPQESTKPFSPPPKTLPRLKFPFTPLQNNENFGARTGFLTNGNLNEIPRQFREKQYYNSPSRRPTVVYCKEPKNFSSRLTPYLEELQDNSNRHFKPSGGSMTSKGWQIDYLSRKYNNLIEKSEIEYIFGECGQNLQKTEEFLSDVLSSGNKLLRTDNNGQLSVINNSHNQAPTFQVNENYLSASQKSQTSSNIKSSTTQDLQTPKEFPDTLFRQVIVDSIKLLYDEDSVLGCF